MRGCAFWCRFYGSDLGISLSFLSLLIITDYNTSATPRRDSAEVLRKFCNLFVTLYSSTLLHFYAFKKRKYFYAEVKGSEPKSKLLVMSYHETFIYVCKS